MFRFVSRSAVTALVALTLVLASVPAAQATPFDVPYGAFERAGWLDSAVSWLTALLFGTDAGAAQPKAAVESTETFTDTDFGAYGPTSGSCIDPQGRPKPCV